MIFQATKKFSIVCFRLILGKIGVGAFAGPPREIYVRYEFGFKAVLRSTR